MKIPKKEVVKFVTRSVLNKKVVDTQAELTELVNEELREITVSMRDVGMKVDIKQGDVPKKCPSCGYNLRKAYSRNLKGKKIIENLRCQRCGYKGHDGKWLPRKYGFRVTEKSG